ncbi:hypothetical protein [Sulfolobus sp. S-194]|uniref:hypothetical protein n=1 Tax=Sulfolobus sp. S-194 TaxID=2512240 RepID=UPI00256FC3CC|nr:hypothetical protein [Sulfolobus sp. S-194]
MTRLKIVENLIKQILALGLVALDAGFYSVDVINYLLAVILISLGNTKFTVLSIKFLISHLVD